MPLMFCLNSLLSVTADSKICVNQRYDSKYCRYIVLSEFQDFAGSDALATVFALWMFQFLSSIALFLYLRIKIY